METIEASDTLPKQVSSMTMWFPNYIWNYITLSCTHHNKESQIIHTKHRRTKQPHPDLDLQVPFHDLRQNPCKERAESLKTEEKLSSQRREKKEKIIGIIQRDNGQEFNIILQRQPQIQEAQIIPSRITNNKIKLNRKKEHLNVI